MLCFFSKSSSGTSSAFSKNVKGRYHSRQIACRTLDDFCQEKMIERIDFIKIDVEGMELQVLYGGGQILKKCKPVMLIEIQERTLKNGGTTFDQLLSTLFSFGYKRVRWFTDNSTECVDLSILKNEYLRLSKFYTGYMARKFFHLNCLLSSEE
ncbi:MAG: FkbM family methyltransferase [Planctomycetes bacterium]|nr:FkbM family methyltransferase [Planctomycetota bacterium]